MGSLSSFNNALLHAIFNISHFPSPILFFLICGVSLLNMDGSLFKDDIWKRFDMYEAQRETDITISLDKIQIDLQCCGLDGPDDWKNATHLDGFSVPNSCCRTMEDGCGTDYFNHVNAVDIYENGCFMFIMGEFAGFGLWFIGLNCTSFVFHIIMCTLKSNTTMRTLCSTTSNDEEDFTVNNPQVEESRLEPRNATHPDVSNTIPLSVHKDTPSPDVKPGPSKALYASISIDNSNYIPLEPISSTDNNNDQQKCSTAFPSTSITPSEDPPPYSPRSSNFMNNSTPKNPSYSILSNASSIAPTSYPPSVLPQSFNSKPTNPSYSIPSNTSTPTSYPSSVSSATLISSASTKDDIRKHFEGGINLHRLITSIQSLLYKREIAPLNLLKNALDKGEVRFSYDNEIGNMRALNQGLKLLMGDGEYQIIWTRTSPGWQ